jgi:hypothetical protein
VVGSNVTEDGPDRVAVWSASAGLAAPDLVAWRSAFPTTGPGVEWAALRDVNGQLWDIEDRIRDKERDAAFDAEFIELARAVYVTNDERAALKKRINTKLGTIVEATGQTARLGSISCSPDLRCVRRGTAGRWRRRHVVRHARANVRQAELLDQELLPRFTIGRTRRCVTWNSRRSPRAPTTRAP